MVASECQDSQKLAELSWELGVCIQVRQQQELATRGTRGVLASCCRDSGTGGVSKCQMYMCLPEDKTMGKLASVWTKGVLVQ